MTKVGRSSPPFTKCSHSSSTSLPGIAWEGTSTSKRSAIAISGSSGVCGSILGAAPSVHASARAALSESYIEMRSHSPPRS